MSAKEIATRILQKRHFQRIRTFVVALFVAWLKLRAVIFREILRAKLVRVRFRSGKPLLVFVRFGALGDIVCTFPAAERLIALHQDLHFVYVTLSEFRTLPEMGNLGGSIVTSRVHCQVPRLPKWVAGAYFQPQYGDELGTKDSSKHIVDEFLVACGFNPGNSHFPHLHIPDEQRNEAIRQIEAIARTDSPIVAIHTGPTWTVREWSNERWTELVRLLAARFNCSVLHLGASRHVELGGKAIQSIPGTKALLGKLSMPQLASVLEQVALVVGVDSGILHLAGAVNTPSVGVFGPTNPALRLPRHIESRGVNHSLPCSFCHHRQPRLHWVSNCPYQISCMQGITAEAVFAACESILAGNNKIDGK